MCKQLTQLNFKKVFFDKVYNYILLDINSLTIVPYLNSEKYLSNDSINITPFIETIKFYSQLKKQLILSKFIFIVDGGISPSILDLYPKYKSNRIHRKANYSLKNPDHTKNVYDYNIGLLKYFFEEMGEFFISDIHRNEADFIIGYISSILSKENEILTISHDKDLLISYGKNDNIDVLYKETNVKNKFTTYHLIDNFKCLLTLINFEYLKNPTELLYYKALIGDKSDNIEKPFGIKSKTIVNNMFYEYYLQSIEVTYENIISYFSKKFNNNENILTQFIKDLRRNLFIINIFNTDLLSHSEKIKLNSYIDEFLFFTNKNSINFNNIYNLFEKYGLHFDRENVNLMFNFIYGK